MEDKQFQELFTAVHKEQGDIWDVRLERLKKILRELLEGEFNEMLYREGRFLIKITELKSNVNAHVFRKSDPIIIEFNSERWEKHPELDFNDTPLRQTLRHELLHVLTNEKDGDWLFNLEAKRRGIDINWNSERNV